MDLLSRRLSRLLAASEELTDTGVQKGTLIGSAEKLLEDGEGFNDEKEAELAPLAVVSQPKLVAMKISGESDLGDIHATQDATIA